MDASLVIDGRLAVGYLTSEVLTSLWFSTPAFSATLPVALRAQSCGVKLGPVIGKGIHFKICGIFFVPTPLWSFTGAFSSWDVSFAFKMGMKTCGGHSTTLYFENKCHLLVPFPVMTWKRRCYIRVRRSSGVSWAHPESQRTTHQEAHSGNSHHCWEKLLASPGVHCPRLSLSFDLEVNFILSPCGTSVLCTHAEEMAVTKAEESPALEPSWWYLCAISQPSRRAGKHLRTKEVLFLWELPVSPWTWIL